jgi:drug/metabolite transporter (DMT)-like permease
MFRVSPNYIAALSVFTGPFFFFIIAAFLGKLSLAGSYGWKVYLFFAVAGIGHFALGRNWAYRSIQLVGATRSNIVTSLHPIITTVLAMIVLKERIPVLMVIGILCSLAGPLLILMKEEVVKERQTRGRRELDRSTLYRGILYGAGTMLFWGSSAIFIKLGFGSGGSPIMGSLIAYTSASLVISPSVFLMKARRDEILHAGRGSLKLAVISGLTTSMAQLLRYSALATGSAIVVSLMLQTQTLWVLIFAFLFSRGDESFSRWVLLGSGLLITGTILILLA